MENNFLETVDYNTIKEFVDNCGETCFKPFETQKPSTMTLVITFDKQINKDALFHTLPITYNPNFRLKRKALLYPETAGLILNCRYMNMQRGPCYKGSFKNSVICDVSTSFKNISVKISNNSFQMCGASSSKDAEEAANIVVDHIHDIIRMQIRMIKKQEETLQILEWLKKVCKGNEKIITGKNLVKVIRNRIKNRKIKVLERYAIIGYECVYPEYIPEEFDREIVNFFLRYIADIHFNGLLYEYYIKKIEIIIGLEIAIDVKPEYFFRSDYSINPNTLVNICDVNVIMVNYNYNIGFKINRRKLAEIALKLKALKVHAKFDLEFVNHTAIDILYEDTENVNIKRNPRKPTHHSLICYRTGSITQSSGSIPGAEMAYNILKYLCILFQDQIEDKSMSIFSQGIIDDDLANYFQIDSDSEDEGEFDMSSFIGNPYIVESSISENLRSK